MKVIVLAATHKRLINNLGREVPLPLVDIAETPYLSKPYLSVLMERLDRLADVDYATIVTNDAIKIELEMWSQTLSGVKIPFRIVSDGTLRPEERKGPVGDLIFALREAHIDDDVLVIGGDNWFTYDLASFVASARKKAPAVVVTRIVYDAQPNRFGWVELNAEKRIVAFLEKPEEPLSSSFLKASCVYYLDRASLARLDEFGAEHETTCSPGTFFAWLSARTAVFGVESPSSWYDIGTRVGMSRLFGPDFIRFRDMVRHHVHPTYSTWQKNAAWKLQWVTSCDDLIDALHDRDVNVRIIAAMILGNSAELMTEPVKTRVIDALLQALNDPSQNQITADEGWEEDEDESVHVSATASKALVALGYERNISAVVERAGREGHPVQKTRNIPE